MKRSFRYIAILCLIMAAACSDDLPGGGEADGLRFSVPTKAGEWEQPTFRILNYNGVYGAGMYQLLGSDTFYWKNETDDELTSCTVSDDGTYQDDKQTVDLNANGLRVIVMTSPAAICGTGGGYVFRPSSESLYMTEPESVQMGNYGLISFSSALRDRRIRLKVKVYKSAGVEMDEFVISDMNISGGGAADTGVTYYPATRQVIPVDATADIGMNISPAAEGTTDASGNLLKFESDQDVYLSSGFYAPETTVAGDLECGNFTAHLADGGNYLYLTCLMEQGVQKADIKIALTTDDYPELYAQNDYVVNIIVKSNYINATMDVYDNHNNEWEDNSVNDNEIKEPDSTIPLGSFQISSWTSVEPGNQEII